MDAADWPRRSHLRSNPGPGADNGSPTRRSFLADTRRQTRLRIAGGLDFCQSQTIRANRRFSKYPRRLEEDRAALQNLGVDYFFMPPPQEMYPAGFATSVVVEGMSDRLEGRARPGHFRGVTTVVSKLFEIVQPRFAYFGRKDAQQARIIRQMAADLNLRTQVVVRPITREPDGLALSSRNVYLQADERRAATALSRSLAAARDEIKKDERNPARLLAVVRHVIDEEPKVALDYAEIVDAETFEPIPMSLRGACYILIAAKVGGTRLIDNALIEQDGDGFEVTV
jgi:pantoate--beta-alanine ligase